MNTVESTSQPVSHAPKQKQTRTGTLSGRTGFKWCIYVHELCRLPERECLHILSAAGRVCGREQCTTYCMLQPSHNRLPQGCGQLRMVIVMTIGHGRYRPTLSECSLTHDCTRSTQKLRTSRRHKASKRDERASRFNDPGTVPGARVPIHSQATTSRSVLDRGPCCEGTPKCPCRPLEESERTSLLQSSFWNRQRCKGRATWNQRTMSERV